MSFMLKDRDKSKHKEPEEATLSRSNIDSDKGKTLSRQASELVFFV